jgi:hypothetical protein
MEKDSIKYSLSFIRKEIWILLRSSETGGGV